MTATQRAGNERGATAVLVALLSMVILGAGAFAVDMGQVYAKRSALQSNVDLAVLAAAAKLDNSGACNSDVVTTATEYLLKAGNEVDGQIPVNLSGSASDSDGYIQCAAWRVELWAPRAAVDFGLAKALSEDNTGVDVPAFAAAEVKSPSATSSMPMFGVSGCDYGSQILRDDSGPADPPPVPPLTPNSATFNTANFTLAPESVPTGTLSQILTLNGTNLAGAVAVGFTAAGGPPDHHEVLAAGLTVNAAGTKITLNVPAAVLAADDVWFVRVFKGGLWSKQASAQRFVVGAPRLYCAESIEGNFGTLNVPRNDTNAFELEWNIIKGMQPALAIHPSPAGECGGDGSPTVESSSAPVDGTNCLETEPGLKIAQTNDGLIKGKGGLNGRLDADTTPGCSRDGDSDRTAAFSGKYLNDDVLSCFIITGARVSDLVAGNAAGTNALSADILKSPRYFWIPILDAEPFNGKKSWPIVDFRPGFITDQPLSATNDYPGIVSTYNGLVSGPSGLRSLNVILFDEAALPESAPAVGGEVAYTGSGIKVIVLVE